MLLSHSVVIIGILTLVKKQSRLDVRKFSFSRGPSMYGINYQRIVYMLVVLICSRIE